MLSGTLVAVGGFDRSSPAPEIAGLAPHRIINRGIGRTFQIPRPFHPADDVRERGAGRLLRAGPAQPRQGRGGRRNARSPWSACRPTARISVDGLGAAGLKKLELAKALATGPKLLLADESLGGLDDTEMDQAADMLRKIRDELGITIIWVEHIMGVLMRVVDRVMVLDHGEKISEGLPSEVSSDPRRGRGLSRHRRRSRRRPPRPKRVAGRECTHARAEIGRRGLRNASRRCSASVSTSRRARRWA